MIINTFVHLSSSTFLEAWPPSCAFGLSATLSTSVRYGQRSCARIANQHETSDYGVGSKNNLAHLNVSLLPPVYAVFLCCFFVAFAFAPFLPSIRVVSHVAAAKS